MRIKLDGADITVTDPASIEQLLPVSGRTACGYGGGRLLADTVGRSSLCRTRGWRFHYRRLYNRARTGNRPFPLRRKRPRWRRLCKNWTSDGLNQNPCACRIRIQEGRQNAALLYLSHPHSLGPPAYPLALSARAGLRRVFAFEIAVEYGAWMCYNYILLTHGSWRVHMSKCRMLECPGTEEQIDSISTRCGVDRIAKNFDWARGGHGGKGAAFWIRTTSSFTILLLPDMERAVAAAPARARWGGERILVVGDSDADGITATAIMMQYLQKPLRKRALYHTRQWGQPVPVFSRALRICWRAACGLS